MVYVAYEMFFYVKCSVLHLIANVIPGMEILTTKYIVFSDLRMHLWVTRWNLEYNRHTVQNSVESVALKLSSDLLVFSHFVLLTY